MNKLHRPRSPRAPWLLVWIVSAWVGTATAEQPRTGLATTAASAAGAQDLDALIARLSADQYRVREQAKSELVALGQAAVPRLRALLNETRDDDLRQLADAALAQIEEDQLIGQSRVTLRFADSPPGPIFDELFRQARAPYRTYARDLWKRRADHKLSIDVTDAPFWQVLKDLSWQTSLEPRHYINEPRMTLNGPAPKWLYRPSVVSGPFLVVAERVRRVHEVDLARPEAVNPTCELVLQAMPEPKLRIVARGGFTQIEQAVDEQGSSLTFPGGRGPTGEDLTTENYWTWTLTPKLNVPVGAPSRRIARVKGRAAFVAGLDFQRLEIPDVLNARNVSVEGYGRRLELHHVEQVREGRYEASFTIHRDGLDAAAWRLLRDPYVGTFMEDAQGRPYRTMGSVRGRGRDSLNGTPEGDRLNVVMGFYAVDRHDGAGKPDEPVKFVWTFPTRGREIVVPFEFTDLPLP